MEGIGPAFGDHLDLAPRCTGEVRRLVTAPNLEFLDALDWSRHHPRGRAPGRTSAGVAVTGRISPLIAVHVVAVVAAVELETVLIRIGSAGVPERRHAHLQRGQSRGI